MNKLIASWPKRLGWSLLGCCLALAAAVWYTRHADVAATLSLTDGDWMMRFLGFPALTALAVFGLLTACAAAPVTNPASVAAAPVDDPAKPFVAQVVGVQW